MIKDYKYIALGLLFSLLITACSKDGADGNDVTKPNEQTKEIRFNADVWKMAEATRATILNNTYLITNGFICTAYTANSSTANGDVNIENNHVTWNGSRWVFDGGTRNWPAGSLDFFAYMPSMIPAYIKNTSDAPSAVTYNAGTVQFKCDNLDQADMTEFVYALALDQNKAGTNTSTQPTPGQVALNFLHPFTRIILRLSENHPAIRINTITFKSIKKSGSYNNGTWTPSGDVTDLVWTINTSYPTQVDARVINDSYLVIPQTWAGAIDVNATWNVWGESQTKTVSTTLSSVTWQRGNSYTYTFTITPTDLTVNTSKFTEQW